MVKQQKKTPDNRVESLEFDVIELQNRLSECREDVEELQGRVDDLDDELSPRKRRRRKQR